MLFFSYPSLIKLPFIFFNKKEFYVITCHFNFIFFQNLISTLLAHGLIIPITYPQENRGSPIVQGTSPQNLHIIFTTVKSWKEANSTLVKQRHWLTATYSTKVCKKLSICSTKCLTEILHFFLQLFHFQLNSSLHISFRCCFPGLFYNPDGR